MRRLILLAIGLSALLWAAAARTASAPPDTVFTMSGIESYQLADDSPEPSGSDQQWRPQPHAIAAVTESVWKSMLVHAAHAATRPGCTFDTARAASPPDPPSVQPRITSDTRPS